MTLQFEKTKTIKNNKITFSTNNPKIKEIRFTYNKNKIFDCYSTIVRDRLKVK